MPHVYKGRVIPSELGGELQLSKMTMRQLIEYERFLWGWMKGSPPSIVVVLNAIYREVEWRAQDTAFR